MRAQSVVNLDPIDRNRKKQPGLIGRFFMTKRFRGKSVNRTDEFGHYLFTGRQRSGKTVSCLFMAEKLKERYEKRGCKVILYSNFGIGVPFARKEQYIPVKIPGIFDLLNNITYDPKVVHIFLIDEIQSWYPKDTKDPQILKDIDRLTGEFSQLGKRQIYVLSTAQVYGRLNKNLREQCLYMVNCHLGMFNKCINDFIPGDDIMCDELGRWSGIPSKIWKHGLPKTKFDTHALVKF